ncbi:cation diffusion facilitator family transporter [Streptosporangium sp. NPDC004379]|uniref:cation diffusion facilitator family transporter n=1 Tax=Streptosporangium sp. NPDC004379 TaxID=3366189 RepID=UPI00369CC9CC
MNDPEADRNGPEKPDPEKSGSESLGTVIVAGLANLAIAIAKLVAGLMSSSAAMMSEAAHSAADTVTEVLLFVAVRRSDSPPDARHPFGHGMAGFFWALMAAFATLIGGAGFSITHGVQEIIHGEELADLRVSYAVLVISFVIESVSFFKALSQVRSEAARVRVSPQRYVARTSDTAVKAVLFEDAAALAGLVIAACGLLAYEMTGDPVWDGVASVAIGLLLLGVAAHLIRANVSLLMGQAAPERLRKEVEREMLAQPEVEDVVELLTMMLGPSEVMVAARVDFSDESTGAALERAADRVEERLRERFPSISHVFLDPTPGRSSHDHRRAADQDS